MPVAFHPDAVRKYVLKTDRKLPRERRAVFSLRYMTRRAKTAYLAAADSLGGLTAEQASAVVYEQLGKVLAGWENLRGGDGQEIGFDAANLVALDDVLTDSELWELYWAAAHELDADDSDFFGSRPSTPPDGSATGPAGSAAV